MAIVTTALGNFIVILAIGIIAGLVFKRYGLSWLGRQVADATGADATYALVGIAGSFIGYHLGVILGLLPYIVAIIGAFVTLWAWRGR